MKKTILFRLQVLSLTCTVFFTVLGCGTLYSSIATIDTTQQTCKTQENDKELLITNQNNKEENDKAYVKKDNNQEQNFNKTNKYILSCCDDYDYYYRRIKAMNERNTKKLMEEFKKKQEKFERKRAFQNKIQSHKKKLLKILYYYNKCVRIAVRAVVGIMITPFALLVPVGLFYTDLLNIACNNTTNTTYEEYFENAPWLLISYMIKTYQIARVI
ncbi:MAG: hypothetical protein LBM05_02185 [Endomicrobium sp.]|jgi:hypothetical protein|nr:hypothetical protein [Endomicrobium sp.]